MFTVALAELALETTRIAHAPAVYTIVPFVAMLMAIAICALRFPHWWESNRNKFIVSLVLGAPVLVLYLRREPGALVHMALEYVSFIILLAGLYVISGRVRLRGELVATPLTNTLFLATGSVLASFVARKRVLRPEEHPPQSQ